MTTRGPTPLPGLRVGVFALEQLLGEGAMARVFRATQHGAGGFKKQVALKMVRGRGAEDPETLEYFINEARIGGYLRHPNIVEIYGFSEEEGALCLAMEYVHGVTASDLVRGVNRRGEQLPLPVAARIVYDALGALGYAHAARDNNGLSLNIIHRDMKPSNILIGFNGQVKVGDFGVARSSSNMNRTVGSTTKGTPAYMSPEQALGEEVDGRSDLFSLASVFYALLTGANPFQAKTLFETMQRIVFVRNDEAIDATWDYWPQLVPFFQRGWQQEREYRYPDAATMRADLLASVPDLATAEIASAFVHSGHSAAHVAIVDEDLDESSEGRMEALQAPPQPKASSVPTVVALSRPGDETILSQPSIARVRLSQPLRVALPMVPSNEVNTTSGYAMVGGVEPETIALSGSPQEGLEQGTEDDHVQKSSLTEFWSRITKKQ